MPTPIRGRNADILIIDDMSFWPEPRHPSIMALQIVERNGRWHVYETTTQPWALVTAFTTEDEAKAYIGLGHIHAGACEVRVGGWFPEVIQEDRKCIVCDRKLYAGHQAHLRSISVYLRREQSGDHKDNKTETKYEVKCLEHTRTRFNRDEPL
jgi:hypothetical protein